MDSSSRYLVVILLVAFLVITVLQMRKQNRRLREVQRFQASVVPGMSVATTSGMHGTIVSVAETTVRLRIADGVDVTWERAALMNEVSSHTDDATTGSSGAQLAGPEPTNAAGRQRPGTAAEGAGEGAGEGAPSTPSPASD